MPLPLIFLDIAPPKERASYIDSLVRVGIGVTDRASTSTTVISGDDGKIHVRAASCDDVRLTRDVAPDDLAQVVRSVLALADARTRLLPPEEVERRALQARTIVHDANNALTPILFAARELCDFGPGVSALARQVLDCANHIATMFRFFLNTTISIVAAPLDVNLAIAGVLRLLASAGSPAPVTTRLSPRLPRVAIDSNDLARVVINLITNAREAAVGASPISVATSTLLLSEADARGVPAGHWVLIEVEDTGIGMDPFTLAHATEPFFTTKRAAAGTGLGLSSALHLVREAGGYLRIDSNEGVGTRVRVLLPAWAP
ncbi:MAG TPA: sensor histidine kinase [Polyangiaceae bacterium]|jgi:signal transduction histidine kinase